MPVRFTVRGLDGSCGTLTASEAVSDAVVVGLNFTPMVQDELPPKDEPQVPPVIVKSGALLPLTALLIEIV